MHENERKEQDFHINDNSQTILNENTTTEIKAIIKESTQSKEDKSIKNPNLLFNIKNISPFKLYTHISQKFELFLMICAVISTIIAGLSNPLVSLLLGDSINDINDTSEIENLSDSDFNNLMNNIENKVNKMVKKFLIFGSIMFVFNFLMMFLWAYSSLRQMHWMKINYFRLILNQEQGWFDRNNPYEFATKVQAQLEQIELGVGDRAGQIILMIVEFISGFIIGFIASWKLSLILLCCTPFIILSFYIMNHFLKNVIISSTKVYEKAGGIAEELLYNIKTISSFANFDYEINRFGKLIDEVEKYDIKKSLITGISMGIMSFGIFFAYAFTLLYTRILIKDKKIESGDAIKVLFTIINAVFSIGGIFPNIEIIKASCIAASDYFNLYERVPEIYLSKINLKPDRNMIKGKIEFKNIKFSYNNKEQEQKMVLNDINLLFEPGKTIAIVGESGCGKSTIINLIERIYESQEGQILLDDVDIKEYNLEYLRSLIGYVQQEPVLFNKSIKENIIFGREKYIKEIGDPDKLVSEACNDSFLKNFIESNLDKYDYIVGIKGSKLSGGEKQRVAIARAILTKPKILLLDEATSALDNESEKEVNKALYNICKKNVTSIIISHRLSSIKNVDIIYALKDGQVIEKGTHEELLNKNGYYSKLFQAQIENEKTEEKNINKNKENENNVLISETKEEVKDEILNVNDIEKKDENIEINRKKILELISDHKLDLILGSLGGIIYGASSPINGLILGKIINIFSLSDTDKIDNHGLKYSSSYLATAFIVGFTIFLKIWKLEGLGAIITSRIRKQIFQKYLELHVGFYDINSNSPGGLLTNLSIDTTQLSSLILSIFGSLISSLSSIITALIIGFIYDWKLTLILLCFIPFISACTFLMGNYKKNGRSMNKKIRIEAGSLLSECVLNTKTIFSFNFQSKALEMYTNILQKESSEFIKDSIMLGILIGIGSFIMYASNAAVFKSSISFIKKKTLTFQKMNIIMYSLLNTTNGISDSLRGIGDYPKAKLAFKSIYKTLNTQSEINAFEYENKNKAFPENFKGKIEFKNVSFYYPTKPNQKILKNISFLINPGEQIAFVGYSGSGKSTIIQLIERFYDVNEGEILIDNINIKDYNLFLLRKKIGLVSQEPVLFKRSIYENILYGKLDSSEEDVYKAAENSSLEKFIKDDEIMKKEDHVSGGEKQRISIARAFIKNPKILLLDEATSALDKETEKEIQKNIFKIQQGRTSISVAHRLSTIVNSDKIYVIESGKIVESGNHKNLLQLKGKYYDLYQSSEM